MIARQVISLLTGLVFLYFFVTQGLKLSVEELVPAEALYLAYGLIGILALYLAFKLSRYLVATADERTEIHRDLVRWIVPMRGYRERDRTDVSHDLVVRQSRIVMISQALQGVIPLFVLAALNAKLAPPPNVQAMLGFFAILFVISTVVALLDAIVADELVAVSPAGLALPGRYKATIPWNDIYTVEMRTRGEDKRHRLYVHFKNPEGASSWRGIIGTLKGWFAHDNHEAWVSTSLRHADKELYDIRAAIDHYLAERQMEVVMRP